MLRTYINVTELPDQKATKEQLSRIYTRYKFASEFCEDKRVLEIACGSGIGLGLLAEKSKEVVACDIDDRLLDYIRENYKKNKKISIIKLDANKRLPFQDGNFDSVVLYESIYYLENPENFVKEVYRILKQKGTLLISLPNKDIPSFIPSPLSKNYLSVPDLHSLLLNSYFKNIKIYGNSLIEKGIKQTILQLVKLIALKLNVIPKTMKGKEKIKRIFFGKLYSTPKELRENMFYYIRPVKLEPRRINKDYKVIFAVAKKVR